MLGQREWLFAFTVGGSVILFFYLGQFHVNYPGVENVDKIFVFVDVLVDSSDIKVRMGLVRQFLEGKKMFEDHAARLEQVMLKAFLFVKWPENSKASRVTEPCVQPTANQKVREHVYLISAQFWFAPSLIRH